MHHVCWSVFPFYVLSQRMYMEPNEPKETAEDTTRPEYEFEEECEPCEGAEWHHAGFEGYPIEDGDD